jgi:DNA polymerase III epsilon subunit-like protein
MRSWFFVFAKPVVFLYNINMPAPKYCSIDLEFTGFDPETEQILEIGFAFFDISDDGILVGEQWSQVFRPTAPVHPKILGLTGISQEEIDAAPAVSDFKDFLSEKLSDVTLVAHNPTLDVKFLEQAGVQLSGRVIDTLELVQFILPTHHSYNLENLMHYFGISHQDSHRALGDSLSTIALMGRLLGIHASFSDELKTQLAKVYNQDHFEWAPLLQYNFAAADSTRQDSLGQDQLPDTILVDFDSEIIIDPSHYLHESRVAKTLQTREQASLLVLSNKQEVMRLWQAGLVEGVFGPKDLFNPDAFESFLTTAQTSEELRFCLKILVWQATNWQTKSVLDLNLSFFGGQFKTYIVDGKFVPSDSKVACADYETFLELATENLETNRELVICDLQRFERFLTFGSHERLSWNYFNFVVKSIYNPETNLGNKELESVVVDVLTAIDLFFGLVQIMLRQSSKQTDYIALSDLEVLQPIYYRRLVAGATNLAEKLHSLAKQAEHDRLADLANELTKFFVVEPNQVKWVELAEENVALHSQPIRIEQIASELFNKYSGVKLTDTITDKELLFYLVERLGLNPEVLTNIDYSVDIPKTEIDLATANQIVESGFIKSLPAPMVIVFASAAASKDFYKQHFLMLKEHFHLYGQEYSGSGNKIFRNFRISGNSLLLATSKFINKQKYSAPAQTLIYVEWPKIDVSQPYYQALLKEYQDKYGNLPEIFSQGDYLMNIKQLSGEVLPKVMVLRKS